MPERLEYSTPPAPFPGARDELEDLIETLHRSGTLRFLNGFFGRLGGVSQVAVDELNTEAGRNLIGALLCLGRVLTRLPSDDLARAAEGFDRGLTHAGEILRSDPPGTFHLLRLLDDAETRRAIAAAVALLNAAAGSVATPDRKKS